MTRVNKAQALAHIQWSTVEYIVLWVLGTCPVSHEVVSCCALPVIADFRQLAHRWCRAAQLSQAYTTGPRARALAVCACDSSAAHLPTRARLPCERVCLPVCFLCRRCHSAVCADGTTACAGAQTMHQMHH